MGYYNKIEVAHIEAGLRSGNKYSPFPEEINRKIISSIADIHFAPTTSAKNNLQNEGIRDNIYITGNTVIDALRIGLEKINKNNDIKYRRKFKDICFSNKIILITGHRRENFGNIIENICQAIKEIATSRNDVEFVYPVHLNPNIHDSVYKNLNGIKNIINLVVNTLEERIEAERDNITHLSDTDVYKIDYPLDDLVKSARSILDNTDLILDTFQKITDRLKLRIVTWDEDKCKKCHLCVDECPSGAITYNEEEDKVKRNPAKCLRCSTCYQTCPFGVAGFYEARFLLDPPSLENGIIRITIKAAPLPVGAD